MLTKIPHFKEIIIASFSCAHCGYENKDIQSAGAVQDTGCSWTLSVKDQEVSPGTFLHVVLFSSLTSPVSLACQVKPGDTMHVITEVFRDKLPCRFHVYVTLYWSCCLIALLLRSDFGN